jgi:hypothetical protein
VKSQRESTENIAMLIGSPNSLLKWLVLKVNKYMKTTPKQNKPRREVKVYKAWILEFAGYFKPMITWDKPTPREVKTARDYGSEYYPCTITYTKSNDQ